MIGFEVLITESAERDIADTYRRLQARMEDGDLNPGYPDLWFAEVEAAIEGLHRWPNRHPYARERTAWGRDIRNCLLQIGYRVLYRIDQRTVYVMRVRHQRQDDAPPER